MCTEAEGIFLWALAGLHRLIANDYKFTLSQSAQDNMEAAVSDGNNIANPKPDPEVFVKAADMLGLENRQCLVVEDAVSGVLAAAAAKMDCAAVGADPAKVGKNSPSAIKKLYTPAPRQSGELIKGDPEEIAKIAVQKLVEQKII